MDNELLRISETELIDFLTAECLCPGDVREELPHISDLVCSQTECHACWAHYLPKEEHPLEDSPFITGLRRGKEMKEQE